jgi:hypothetical protein
VGIVIPDGYQAAEDAVNYVVHFHGHSNHVTKVLEMFKLGEQLAASKANAILLVPQGPKDVPDGGDGKVELDQDGLKNLLEEVTQFLHGEGKIKTDRIGKVVISAHSAGYRVAASVLDHGGMGEHVTDVLLLDSLGSVHMDWFAKWCTAAGDGRRLVSLFGDHRKPNAQRFMEMLDAAQLKYDLLDEKTVTPEQLGRRGVILVPVTLEHNDVPVKTEFFRRLLETSALGTAKRDGQ